jgi:hypothetical protein
VKFNAPTVFFDYEGMPVTSHLPQTGNEWTVKRTPLISERNFLCWDFLPPRAIPADSVLRNAAPCNETRFRSLVLAAVSANRTEEVAQGLLYKYWFDECAEETNWQDWLDGLKTSEILVLVHSLKPALVSRRDSLDDASQKRLDHQIVNVFSSCVAFTNSLKLSFVFFIQDLRQRLDRLD